MAGRPENVIDVKTLWKFYFSWARLTSNHLYVHVMAHSPTWRWGLMGEEVEWGGGITVRHVEIIPHRSLVTCVSFVFGVFSRALLSSGSVPLCLSKDESVYWGTSLMWDQTLRATDPLSHEEGYCTARKTRPRRIKTKQSGGHIYVRICLFMKPTERMTDKQIQQCAASHVKHCLSSGWSTAVSDQ